ncbi:hypothetical protein NNF59_002704 [Providencia stuartii]|nr:hypothetical protein [Providencia stuartii]
MTKKEGRKYLYFSMIAGFPAHQLKLPHCKLIGLNTNMKNHLSKLFVILGLFLSTGFMWLVIDVWRIQVKITATYFYTRGGIDIETVIIVRTILFIGAFVLSYSAFIALFEIIKKHNSLLLQLLLIIIALLVPTYYMAYNNDTYYLLLASCVTPILLSLGLTPILTEIKAIGNGFSVFLLLLISLMLGYQFITEARIDDYMFVYNKHAGFIVIIASIAGSVASSYHSIKRHHKLNSN